MSATSSDHHESNSKQKVNFTTKIPRIAKTLSAKNPQKKHQRHHSIRFPWKLRATGLTNALNLAFECSIMQRQRWRQIGGFLSTWSISRLALRDAVWSISSAKFRWKRGKIHNPPKKVVSQENIRTYIPTNIQPSNHKMKHLVRLDGYRNNKSVESIRVHKILSNFWETMNTRASSVVTYTFHFAIHGWVYIQYRGHDDVYIHLAL